jgi:hypothetical protein
MEAQVGEKQPDREPLAKINSRHTYGSIVSQGCGRETGDYKNNNNNNNNNIRFKRCNFVNTVFELNIVFIIASFSAAACTSLPPYPRTKISVTIRVIVDT